MANSNKDIIYSNACIYLATIPDGRNYVGSCENFEDRKRQHRYVFNNPKHKDYNLLLYKETRKFGNVFHLIEFKVLNNFEHITYKNLHQKEYEYVIQFNAHISMGGLNTQWPNRDAQKNRQKI